MKKWIFTFKEVLEFYDANYADKNYHLFLEDHLCQRHDGYYVCGSWIINPNEAKAIDVEDCFYKDCIFLITEINIDSQWIIFNVIGTKDELLNYLEK